MIRILKSASVHQFDPASDIGRIFKMANGNSLHCNDFRRLGKGVVQLLDMHHATRKIEELFIRNMCHSYYGSVQEPARHQGQQSRTAVLFYRIRRTKVTLRN